MTQPLDRLDQALSGRYRVNRQIGAGGMATVYLAQDLKHNRPVAIKALRPELAAAIGRERFLAEIAATARLQHPNILPLFDSGEAGDLLFYVMPYVAGTSLRGRLEAEPRLPIDEAIEICCGVAAALHHAHHHGVVHRDIKPDNILLCDGVPVVADFGIALALERADQRLTETGLLVGTPSYMSPEQSSGEPVIDARSDVYSLACVLFQMLAGEPPHTGASLQAILARRFTTPPPPIRRLRPTVPAHVEAALERALALAPADRFPGADAFAAALRNPEAATAARQAFMLRAEPRSYGVLMHEGDEESLTRARARARELVEAAVRSSGGTLHPSAGDALVAVFQDAHACLGCGRAARDAVAGLNAELPVAERVHYRFGIAEGEVRADGVHLTGSGVEIASELATVAGTDAINVGDPVRARLPEEALGDGAAATPAPGLPQLEGLDLPPPARPSIAIMPFCCPGEDPEGEAIAEGLRIDITNALMKIGRIFLVAPSTMNHFRGGSAAEAARKVGTRHVLEGTVRRSGERVRVTVQLSDTAKGSLAWTERYDRVLDDAFELQDEIASRVIAELDVRLSLGEQARVWKKCLAHPDAREHYYRGLNHFFQGTRDGVAAARGEFERVAERVPESPVGPTWTALALWIQATRGWSEDAARLSIDWAQRAANLPDADGQAHTVLGATLLLDRRWDDAIRIARDSVRIRPGCNTANGILANVLVHCAEYQDAILHAKRAIRIGPVYPPWFLEILSSASREAGRLDAAIAVGRETLRLAPDGVSGRLVLGSALVRAGWTAEARHVVGPVPRLEPGFAVDAYLANQPFRSDQVTARLADDLRAAGLN